VASAWRWLHINIQSTRLRTNWNSGEQFLAWETECVYFEVTADRTALRERRKIYCALTPWSKVLFESLLIWTTAPSHLTPNIMPI
jgi:hypothetical protein